MRSILHLPLHMRRVAAMFSLGLFSASLSFAEAQQSATLDPGPRGGTPAAGGPMPGLNNIESAYFYAAQARFVAINSVTGTIPGQPSTGLGPRFNSNSCASCHAQPAVGGTSPKKNPAFKVAKLNGAANTVPSFEDPNGPILEARFRNYPDGSPDGYVHQLFTIAERTDAGGCSMAQPDFASQIAAKNVSFRMPTPLFGLGLVEAIPDLTLQHAFNSSSSRRASLGISGHFNISANDSTISRFGWKAQNKSLLMFSGEAYNVEMGVSNELFTNQINTDSSCANPAGTPEDDTNLTIEFGQRQSGVGLCFGHRELRRLRSPPRAADPGGVEHHDNNGPADILLNRMRRLPHDRLHYRRLGDGCVGQQNFRAVFRFRGSPHGKRLG